MIPKISVIIPTYNSQDIISDCLQSLEQQTINRQLYEIIVVDDGSVDKTTEVVSSFPDVNLISIPHAGPSVARNSAAKAAAGELIVFTDSDCVPAPDWLEKITAPFHNQQIIGAKGVYRTTQKNIVSRFVQLEYQYKYERMARQDHIDFIDTYSAVYRKSVFLSNGGFDASFTVPSVEDQELSFRLAQKGYRMVFAKDAAVYHRHDRNLLDYWIRKFGIGYWKAYMLRWLPQKLFTDSHTSPSQRLQIAFLGLAIISALVGIFIPWFFGLAAAFVAIFYFTGVPFWIYLVKEDPAVSAYFPLLVVARAAALGMGLLLGFLSPPQKDRHFLPSLPIGTYIIKRVVDILGSVIGLLISAPIFLIAGIAIRLDSPGPIFFAQTRAGENGKPFRMYKLRTMVNGAESKLSEVFVKNNLTGPVYKIPNDPRVTRVGRWLRRWSLDETPQFWNVLKGEMSLVGPRPEEMWVVALYNDEQRQRLVFKPGMTGPMQINGRGELDFDQRLKLEIEYIQNYSIVTDFHICKHSLPAIIKGKGAL